MGTRSLTVFQGQDGKDIAVLYRQFDGYLSGHGANLKEILGDMIIVNGFSGDEGKAANGMECLACQLIAELKVRQNNGTGHRTIGNYYLHPAGTRDCGEAYTYILKPGPQATKKFGKRNFEKEYFPLHIEIRKSYGDKPVIYDGSLDAFDPAALEGSESDE